MLIQIRTVTTGHYNFRPAWQFSPKMPLFEKVPTFQFLFATVEPVQILYYLDR
jgi:hypothetical protein